MAERFVVKERSEADVAALFDATVRQVRARRILKRVRGWKELNKVRKAFIEYVMDSGGQSMLIEVHLLLEPDGDEFRLLAALFLRVDPGSGKLYVPASPKYLS